MKEEKPWSAVYKETYMLMEKKRNKMFKESGVTSAQLGVLVTLHLSEEPFLTMKELEKRMCLAQSTVVGLVARLEQKGLVECCQDENDRRIKWVKRSEAGVKLCDHTRREMHRMDEEFLKDLTPQERESFVRLLCKVRASLEEEETQD